MTNIRIGFAFLVLAIAAPNPGMSQDRVTGKRLAEQWCAECHDIVGRTTSDVAPGFRTLANDPSRSRKSLRTFLRNPHPPMPRLTLGRQEIDDLISHILSLKNDQ